MARDYAGQRRPARGGGKARKPAASRRPRAAVKQHAPWRWFAAGLACGVFFSLMLYLVTLPPAPGDPVAQEAGETAPAPPPKPRFDFYTMLPEQTIDVEVEPADVARPRGEAGGNDVYLLQAGSFRQRKDADSRRAQLLLLGLEPRIEESSNDNGHWFRVFLGPYESRSAMARARSLTAGQDIDTLLIKRSR